MRYASLIKAATMSDYAVPAALGGATLGGAKFFHDAGRLQQGFNDWNSVIDKNRASMKAHRAGGMIPAEDASRMLDDYIRGARGLSGETHRVMGVRPGNIIRSNLGLNAALERPSRFLRPGKFFSPDNAPQWAQGPLKHYELYTNPKTPMNELRFHHSFEPVLRDSGERAFFDKMRKAPDMPQNYIGNMLRRYQARFGAEAAKDLQSRVLRYSGLFETSGPVANTIGDTKGILGNAKAYYNTLPRGILQSLRKVRNPMLALGAGLTAATGLGAWNRRKSASMGDTATDMAAGGGLGAGAYFVGSGAKSLSNPNRNIATTFGQMGKQYNSWDIGSGHKNPGEALFDILKREQATNPEYQKFNLSKIIRNEAGILDHAKIKPNYNVVADTGLGLFQHEEAGFNRGKAQFDKFFRHNPNPHVQTRVGFMTDMLQDGQMSMSNTTSSGLRPGRDAFFMYGPETAQSEALRHSGVNVVRTNKTLTPLVGRTAWNAATGNSSRAELLSELTDFYRTKGNNPELAKLFGGISPNDKLLTISGSGRGDLVAQRAKEISDVLKQRKINNVKVIAQLAGSAQDPQIARAVSGMSNVIPVKGRLPIDIFNGLQRISDIHMGSTGTSSLTENMLQRGGMNVVPKTWGKWFGGDPVQGGLWDRSLKNFPGQEAVDIDAWNQGNRSFASKMKGGLRLEDDAGKIVDMLTDDKLMQQARVDAAGRAETVAADLLQGQKNTAKNIFDIAKRNVRKQRLRGGLRGALGLGLGAAGAGLLHNRLTEAPLSKWEQFLKRTGLDAWVQ